MKANNITTSTTTTANTAKALQTLYFTRTAFSVIWVTLIAIYAKTSPQIAAILLVIYPAWDVVGTLLDIRANKNSGDSLKPQYINLAISIAVTFAVGFALTISIPTAIIVFGIWASLTGIIQLVLGLRRKRELGGQWPMILSGGQSTLAGITFIAMAHNPTMGIVNLAGYSAFGAFYYLLAALRLSKSARTANKLAE